MMRMLAISKEDTAVKWDLLIYLGLFVALNPITTFGASDFILVASSFFMALYLFIWKKEKIDMIFIWIILYWCGVNLVSFLMLTENGTSFKLSTFIGSILKLFIGYGLMKICGIRFIVWFYRITFVLAIISIPFFILQLVNPSVFYSIPFNFAVDFRAMEGHWNGIIFNYSTFQLERNSGFAGEPGEFGYFLGMAMIFNLILNEGRFNRNFLIMGLIGLTTFSTNFYLSLVLFGLYFLSSAPWTTKVIYLVVCLIFGTMFYQLPFIGEKIDTYMEETESMAQSEVVKSKRVNRMATFVNHMNDVFSFPIGYGVNEAQRTKNVYGRVIDGTNGLSRIALRFGIYGLIFFLVIYFKLFRKLTMGYGGYTLMTIIMLMYISANSMERDNFAMAIFWLYFITDPAEIRLLIENWNKDEEEEDNYSVSYE